ncbi:MAG TPA: aspartate aminotransferase family protein [Microthrixaceae bacterium]|nr:aspartate aminotransferase family protein [Microthrixaceae bacterium]
MTVIDRSVLARRLASEEQRFIETHPKAAAVAAGGSSLLAGVPMAWMTRWPGAFPIIVDEASGARFVDIDGHSYVDFCLGDTGAMTGHGLAQVADAIERQARRCITTMLPSPDAAWVGDELARRFGLASWQMAMTATDANRFVLRFARHLTGRPKVLVFNWCYHGTVDETFAVLDDQGRVVTRPGTIGSPVPVSDTTKVVEFNDLDALEAALAPGDVAAVLAEPALTNIGIVLPDPGYHEALREICDRTGTLLVIDETHTLCVGPGGATREWDLRPDFFVIGKAIAGGVPAAAYGMSAEIAERLGPVLGDHTIDTAGVGGTLTGNALALAAIRATLSSTLRGEDFARMIPLAQAWSDGVQSVIDGAGLAWSVNRLGCRSEYWFCPPPRNGRDAAAAVDEDLEAYLHLHALNRGVLLTPFHNMALMSPAHTSSDVEAHTAAFREAVDALVEPRSAEG